MRLEQAEELLLGIHSEFEKTHPGLSYCTCTEGGHIVFTVPSGDFESIVLAAPVTTTVSNGRRVKYVNSVSILEPGCTVFEDTYRTDNVIITVPLDTTGMTGQDFRRSVRTIREALGRRLDNNI